MKAFEIIDELFTMAKDRDYSTSCDKCVCGDPDKDVKKVAVTLFPTVKVIKEATEWGADLLIAHEPLYYGQDALEDDKIINAKRALVSNSGLTIYRYHDHPHHTAPDIIAEGEFKKLGLQGRMELTDVFDLMRFYPDTPITAAELAKLIEERLGVKHVRICGARNIKSSVISSVFGAAGNATFNELRSDLSRIVLVGETMEWWQAEYARDAALLGFNKSLLILGHAGSERDGMELTAEIVKDSHPELEVKYFDCEEVYTYR